MQLKIVSQFALCAGAAIALAQAAEYTKPNIKPGLWEVTVTPKMSGEMPIPDDQLAKMTPDQVAKIKAAMQSAGSKPHVYKDCMTPEKIAKGFEMGGADQTSCKRNIVSSTASELTVHDECTHSADRKSVSDVHFEFKGGSQINGKLHIVTTSAGKSMTIDSTVEGKFVAASCGAVKDTEPAN